MNRPSRPTPPAPGRGRCSDKEQEDVAAFIRQAAPNRWAALEALPENGTFRRGIMVYVVARWRHLQMLREDDPALYDIKVHQLTVEDNIYGLLACTRGPADREALRKKLHDKVAELVKLTLADRQHRIERLRQALKTEEDRLSQDQAAMESLIQCPPTRSSPMAGNTHPDLPRNPRRAVNPPDGPAAPAAPEDQR